MQASQMTSPQRQGGSRWPSLSSNRPEPQVALLPNPGSPEIKTWKQPTELPEPLYFGRLGRGETRGGVTLAPSGLLASQGKGRHTTQGSEDSRRA